MNDPTRFLTTFAQALSTMALYSEGHPARERVIEGAYRHLADLQTVEPELTFSFLGDEVVFGESTIRELRAWEWNSRLSACGVERIEFTGRPSLLEFSQFLDSVLARLTQNTASTAETRQSVASCIRFGQIGVKGARMSGPTSMPVQTARLSLGEETGAIEWLHDEVQSSGDIPMLEAEAVVRSLALAMHSDSSPVLPLLQLKDFDQYTTTHSLNVAVLTMALAETIRLDDTHVRSLGLAGLLHDVGKVRVPIEILTKPGKLTDAERHTIQQHTVEGARIILAGEERLDVAATVAYEHHLMLDGSGYPPLHYERGARRASRIVHVCDVYDALRTKRPYRDAWESERALAYVEERAGVEFDADLAQSFVAMMRQWDQSVVEIRRDVAPAAAS
jgi:putative nucleotidyltransferase with HDIG domain